MTLGERGVLLWSILRIVLSPRTYALWSAPGLHRFGCPADHCTDQVHIPLSTVMMHRLVETLTACEYEVYDKVRTAIRAGEFESVYGDAGSMLHSADAICAKHDQERRNALREKLGLVVEEVVELPPETCEECGQQETWEGKGVLDHFFRCRDESACAARALDVKLRG